MFPETSENAVYILWVILNISMFRNVAYSGGKSTEFQFVMIICKSGEISNL